MKLNERMPLLLFILLAFVLLAVYVRRVEYIENNDDTLDTFTSPATSIAHGQEMAVIDTTEDVKSLGYSGQRKIAQYDANTYFIAYRKKFESVYQIFIKKIVITDGSLQVSGGEKPIAIVPGGVNQRVPSVMITNDKVIHVVWYGSNDQENNRQIKYAQSVDGGQTWSSWKNIAEVNGYVGQEFWQEHPVVATDGKMLYVAWEGKDDTHEKQQIKFIKSSDGGKTWERWKNVHETSAATQSRPAIVVTNGRLHMFMYSALENANNLQGIQYATSTDKGDTWTDWKTISDENFDARHISATVDQDQIVHVVWRQQTVSDVTQIIYRKLNGDTWGDSVMVTRSAQNQFFPSIGVAAQEVWVAWMEKASDEGFPNEDPTPGMLVVARSEDGSFVDNHRINMQGGAYPNVPDKVSRQAPLVLYESQVSDNEFNIIFEANI